MRRIAVSLALVTALLGMSITSFAAGATTYTPESPLVDTVSGGPWNTSQGDPSAAGAYSSSDLLPTFSFGGSETTLGGVSEPNLAGYPSALGATPYPSGVAGTPGPLDGYCSSLGANPETGAPVSQPAGSLPMSPYYFPDIVRNADGSLTGYFDYRPKDANEAITVATSTDNGATWSTSGEALEQNHGVCPTADSSDDGQGHPYVMAAGGTSDLYTLQRPAGDNTGIGMLVHKVEPAAADPLSGLPGSQPVGVDPNTFAATAVSVPTSGEGVTIPVTTLGSPGSPEQIVAGPYEDLNATSPSQSIIRCAGTSTELTALTGCLVEGGAAVSVSPNDDLVQVIATANPVAPATFTVPVAPNKPSGEGGLEKLKFLNGNPTVSPVTTYLMNLDAPNRVYIDGQTVNCAQANANPTTTLENCTTTGSAPLTVHQGDAITADPILPSGTAMTTGLIAPDGIVGTLPKYPGAPQGSTVVLYTEKLLSYFIVGTTDGSVSSANKYTAGKITLPAATINFKPSVTASEPLPPSGPITIYLGTEVGQPIQAVTCTGVAPATQTGVPAGSENLTGCTGGAGPVAEGNWIGGPNAATAPYSVLSQIGEGTNSKSKGPQKLFGNNEDLTVLRAAYTNDGVNFTDLGPISGSTSGTGDNAGSYNDISNPLQTTSPSSTSPTSLSPGSTDTNELRFVGSRGTIITNPDGSLGMFLSGAWASDGDSDAFNQIFYSSSTNGQEWSVPKVVLSTDYSFAASAVQDEALKGGIDAPLSISGYYSGRAYGPSVVQNPDGSLTMVFAGYRLPKPIASAGTILGTNPSALYTVGEKDPALYRDILTMRLTSATSPGVSTATALASSDEGAGVVGAPVTYTATVAPQPPGAGTPTGTVSFSNGAGPIAGCGARPLGTGSPDTATCITQHQQAGAEEVTASYSGDSNYGGSSATADESVTQAPTITSVNATTFTEGSAGSFTVIAGGTPTPTLSETGTLPNGVTFDPNTGKLSGTPTQEGVFPITFTAANGVAPDAVQSFTLTVDAPPLITSADEATFVDHVAATFTVTATGTPAPTIVKWGTLPPGMSFAGGVLSGTPTQTGTYELTFTASNGVGANSVQQFTLNVVGLHITTTSLPPVTPGTPYSQQLTATGGVTPLRWKISAGSLPSGLHLSNAGLLAGKVALKKYPHGGSFPVTVTVTDSTKKTHQTAGASLTVEVS
ncbi:MAG: putative Ig domain-containing protein [Solirubrobacteraceae bacterium]